MKDQYMELYTKLSRLQWLLQRHHAQTHAGHGPAADPTRGQGRVLAMLRLQPEITTKDLSYVLGIRQQSLNELLNKLEKGGYVTRVPSEDDRRVMVVRLTEKGKGEEQPRTDFSDAFSCLTEEEQADFGKYLDRVIAELESQLSSEDKEEIEQWMRAARSRMGSEQFDRLMGARSGFHHHHNDRRYHEGFRGDDRFHGGFAGFGRPGGRGPMPEDMRGAQRFDPDYDGPMPDGCDRRASGRPDAPPAPPKGPHDPEDE